ncbi:hypothetical protein Tco_0569710 [Tanacetum coccineum]
MFQSNVSVGTCFTQILQASNDFIVEGRVAWVEIESVPLKMCTDNESYEGKPNGDDLKNATELAEDSNLEVVSDSKLDEEPLNINMEEALVGQKDALPLGFTPRNDSDGFEGHPNKQTSDCSHNTQEEDATLRHNKSGSKENFKDDVAESVCSGHFKKSDIPRTRGSIINVMEELVKVGHTMGFNMEGCSKNIEDIIGYQVVNDVFR